MTMDNEWKNSLRERFSDYAAPEPEGLWEGIEQGIAGKPRRKMLPVWLLSGLAAAAAVALVVFLPTRKAVEPKTPELDPSLESVLADAVPVDTTSSSTQASTGEPEVAPVASPSVPFAVASRRTLLAEAEPVASVPVSEETVPEAVPEIIPEVIPEIVPVADPPVEEKNPPKNVEEALESIVPSLEITPEPEHAPAPARNRFSVGAYGNGGQAAREQLQGYGMNRTEAYLNTRTIGGNAQNDVGGMIRMLASNKASNFEVHHAAPLRVGLTAAYGLTSHLSLVSGLNWTYLNSEFEESSDPMRTVTSQALGYLGIPLRLEAGTNLGKGLWVYAGVGGMVEKGLMSASRTYSWVDGQQKESTDNPKPDTGGLLWSIGATAGAEYRFSPAFGLYVSPGIEYHFDNGSPVRSAYTEKPLHWNVNLGARFHFGI